MSGNDIHAVERGWRVHGADGGSLGSVAEVTDAYVRLSGGPLGGEVYVPAARLAEVRDGEVRLDVSADEVDRDAWSSPPAAPPARHDALINLDDSADAAQPAATADSREPDEALTAPQAEAGYGREEIARMAHPDYAAQAGADDEHGG